MHRINQSIVVCAAFLMAMPSATLAFCLPPQPPAPTSEALAREFEQEFRQDFEGYFRDANAYYRCMEQEHTRVGIEVEETARRYNRFLTDAEKWRGE